MPRGKSLQIDRQPNINKILPVRQVIIDIELLCSFFLTALRHGRGGIQ
jgi:hypothetical protein